MSQKSCHFTQLSIEIPSATPMMGAITVFYHGKERFMRFLPLLFCFGCVTSVLAEDSQRLVGGDFSRCTVSQPLDGQDGWTAIKNCVSPQVREMLVGNRVVPVVGAPVTKTPPTDMEARKTSQAVYRTTPLKDAKTVLVQAEMMVDGYPPNQAVMFGFGHGTPIQFGCDLFGSVGVRGDQWGAVHAAADVNGNPFRPARGVWYRLTLELTPLKTDAVRVRLFLRDLEGKDKRVPTNKDVLLFFDRRESLDMTVKYPIEKWDTFWLRASDTSIHGDGGYLVRFSIAVAGTPIAESNYVAVPLTPVYEPVRTTKELERLIDLKKSDILLSSRSKRPRDKDDPYDSFEAIAGFHATRLEWCYTVTPEFVRDIKEKGGLRRFGGTINTMFKTGKQHVEKALPGHLTDRAGKPVTGPWMLPHSLWWGCVNSDEYREYYVDRLGKLIDAGVDTIHMDDPGLNEAGVKWGACFCPYCVRGYRQFLKESDLPASVIKLLGDLDTVDPRSMERPPYFIEFQEESVRRFYRIVRKAIREKAGRDIMFSCNNYAGNWPFPAIDFDFGVSEIPERNMTPRYMFDKIRKAEELGKLQIFTFVSRDGPWNRRAFATMYASGGHSILPWDVYIPPITAPRHFTEPKDFADLTAFVRGVADRLDGYEAGPAAGFGFDASSADGILVSNTDSAKETSVSAFLRKKAEAPPVLHLVSWGEPESTSVEIPVAASGLKGIPKTVSLLTPISYDAEKHREAEKTGDFTSLVGKRSVAVKTEKDRLVFTVPPFGDWGVVCLEE